MDLILKSLVPILRPYLHSLTKCTEIARNSFK